VPLADLFSYTRYGARWITHEWGFSLASFLVYRAAGAAGLVVLTPVLALAVFSAVAWRAVELAAAEPDAGAGPALTPSRCLLLVALLALGLWVVSPEVFLRAALAGELMLALALAALARYRGTGRRRWLVGLVALFWAWANLHSGVLFGLGVLALYALEPVARRPRSWRAAAPYLWTLAAAVVAALLNPNGADAPLYPFILGRILFASGIPWELGHFSASAPNASGAGAALWLLLVLLLLGLLPLRQARRLSLAEAASIAAFLLLTLFSHRFVFDLVVVGLPTLYKLLALPPPPAPPAAEERAAATAGAGAETTVPLTGEPGTEPGGAPARSAATGAIRPTGSGISGLASRPALAAALVALFLLPVGPAAVAAATAAWRRWPPAAGGLIAEHFPEAAVRFVAAQGIAGPGDRVFNHQNYGGLLGWRLRVPVFWDGRNDVFAELVREVAAAPFSVTARRHGVDWLLIAEHDYPGILPEIAAGHWGLVYWDDFCAVYLRRGPRYAALLERFELRLFPPFGGRPGLAALTADPGRAAAARAELAQVLAANPAVQRALYFEGMISLYRGDLSRGEAELLAASRIRPSDQVDRVLDLLHHPPPRRGR
jgi:hypothetical protein